MVSTIISKLYQSHGVYTVNLRFYFFNKQMLLMRNKDTTRHQQTKLQRIKNNYQVPNSG